MVKTNRLEGFKESVRALWEYDLVDEVARNKGDVKGLFIVGEGDGVLPKSMKAMADSLGGRERGWRLLGRRDICRWWRGRWSLGELWRGFLGSFRDGS